MAAKDENAHAKFFLSCIHHLTEGKINWAGVAADNKITYARNASARFNSIAAHYGYKMEAGRCVKLDTSDGDIPKTPGGGKRKVKPAATAGSAPSSAKKRKAEESEFDDVFKGTEDEDDREEDQV